MNTIEGGKGEGMGMLSKLIQPLLPKFKLSATACKDFVMLFTFYSMLKIADSSCSITFQVLYMVSNGVASLSIPQTI